MPRIKIRRDQTGNAVRPVAQGQATRICVANVTYPANLHGIVQAHQTNIWATAVGNTGLHNSSKVKNLPAGALGYIHSNNNVLIAVKRLDTNRNTIELFGNIGHVNAGKHIF